jgi:hypothetical protein
LPWLYLIGGHAGGKLQGWAPGTTGRRVSPAYTTLDKNSANTVIISKNFIKSLRNPNEERFQASICRQRRSCDKQ